MGAPGERAPARARRAGPRSAGRRARGQMIRPAVRTLLAAVLVSVLVATGAAADPWMTRERAAGHAPAPEAGGLRSRGGSRPTAPPSAGDGGVLAPAPPTSRPLVSASRDLGVTRAVDARGDPIVVRLGHRRMTQVHFPADVQQVVTAFTKPQVSLETAGPRLFLSALDPDVSGEVFVTLSTGGTLALVLVPAATDERDV